MSEMDSEQFAAAFEDEIDATMDEEGVGYDEAVTTRASQWVIAQIEDVTGDFFLGTFPALDRGEAVQLTTAVYRAAKAGLLDGMGSFRVVPDRKRGDPYGYYLFDDLHVYFNDNFDFEALRSWHGRGDIVHDTVEWVVVHELGHHQHNVKLEEVGADDDFVNNSVAGVWFDGFPDEADDIRKFLTSIEDEVSDYARKSVGEFVAEMFAGLCLGMDFSDEMMEVYEEFHGPETYRQYRDMFDPLPNKAENEIEAAIDGAIDGIGTGPGLPLEIESSAEATAESARSGFRVGDGGGPGVGVSAKLPPEVKEAGGPHPQDAERLVDHLLDYGAERVLVHTNQSTGETTVDFESPLPGDAPQRASVVMRSGQIEGFTLRLGVLRENAFEGHPTHNPVETRRLKRIANEVGVPGGSLVANYGDDRYPPRPHFIVNWVPSVAEDYEIIRREPMEPVGVGEFMRFLHDVTEAVSEEFDSDFVAEDVDGMVRPAKTKPDFAELPDDKRDEIKIFYLQNARQYARVWEKLHDTRIVWQQVSRSEQESLLIISYMQAVMSVRISWEKAEETFRLFMEGESIMDAWEQSNHGLFNKRDYMLETLANDEVWEVAADEINSGNVDAAHDILLADAKYVGDAKAPFVLSNLGFVQKMCIDTNIANLFEEDQPEGLSTGEYEEVCADVRQWFPELSDQLEPAELQWVLFSYARINREFDDPLNLPPRANPVDAHDVWFRYVPGRTRYIHQRANAATKEAKELVEDSS